MNPIEICVGTEVQFGFVGIRRHGSNIGNWGKKPLLVTTPTRAESFIHAKI